MTRWFGIRFYSIKLFRPLLHRFATRCNHVPLCYCAGALERRVHDASAYLHREVWDDFGFRRRGVRSAAGMVSGAKRRISSVKCRRPRRGPTVATVGSGGGPQWGALKDRTELEKRILAAADCADGAGEFHEHERTKNRVCCQIRHFNNLINMFWFVL
jgi:hypothetical protein